MIDARAINKKLRDKMITEYYGVVQAALKEQIDYFIAEYRKDQTATPDYLPMRGMAEAVTKIHLRAGGYMARTWKTAITKRIEKATGKDLLRYQYVILQYLKEHFMENAVLPITETTRAEILKVLAQAATQGAGYEWGVSKVVGMLEHLGESRARIENIVRTESTRASAVGSMAGALDSGILTNKGWGSAQDDRTRRKPRDLFDHLHMNEVTVGFDEKFPVPGPGGVELMDFPGDPKGSAANVCRCFLPDELTNVNLMNIKKAFRSFYNGQVITVQCANGKAFTCTPNHPILTDKGWIAAGMITQGIKLIQSDFVKDSLYADFKVNDSPSTFEQIYNTLSKVGHIVRKPGIVMDFYGDGSTSDIDVVSMESLLNNWVMSGKGLQNGVLKYTNLAKAFLFGFGGNCKTLINNFQRSLSHCFISLRNKVFPFFGGSLGHSQIHGFAPTSLSNAQFVQAFNDRATGATKMRSKSFDTETGIIEGFDLGSGERKTTECTMIGHSNYEGFVYTFETKHQMYDINGLVAKNCRCFLTFEPVRDHNRQLIALDKLPPQGPITRYMRGAYDSNISQRDINKLINDILKQAE